MNRIVKFIESIPPVFVFVFFMLVGVLQLLGCFLLELNEMIYDGKQVGYVYEINWIWNQVIVIPLALFFSFSAISKVKDVLKDLTRHGMFVDKENRPLTDERILEEWRIALIKAIKCSMIFSVIIFIACYIQAFAASPFLFHTLQDYKTPPSIENVFWAWKALVYPASISALSNAVFNFAVFSIQAIDATLFLSFIVLLTAFAGFIYRCSKHDNEIRLIPYVNSTDSRKGFEIFSSIIEDLMIATIFFFFVFYLMRIQIIYKASSAPDIYTFIRSEVVIGFFGSLSDLIKQGKTDLFDIGGKITYTSAISMAATYLAIAFAILIPAVVLRQAAERSKTEYEAAHNKAIEAMTFWPMKYPRPNQLILFSLFAVICFVFYRFGMFFIGTIVYIVVDKSIKLIRGYFQQQT